MLSYTVKFTISLPINNYEVVSKGFFIRNNSDYFFISNTHSYSLDRNQQCEIYLSESNKIYGTIFKYPFYTDIIIIKPILQDNKVVYYNLNKIQKKIHKEPSKLDVLIDDRFEKIEFTKIVWGFVCDLPEAPNNIFLETKSNFSLKDKSISGSPVFNKNKKIVGVVDKFNKKNGNLYLIPSFYIWKVLNCYNDNIIQNLDLPTRIENFKSNEIKIIFTSSFFDNSFCSGDIINKIDGYNINNNLQIYDPSIGTYIPLSTYFLIKEDGFIDIEVIRNREVRKIKNIPLEDINHMLSIKIDNRIPKFIEINELNSGLIRFLKNSKIIDFDIYKKILTKDIKNFIFENGEIKFI